MLSKSNLGKQKTSSITRRNRQRSSFQSKDKLYCLFRTVSEKKALNRKTDITCEISAKLWTSLLIKWMTWQTNKTSWRVKLPKSKENSKKVQARPYPPCTITTTTTSHSLSTSIWTILSFPRFSPNPLPFPIPSILSPKLSHWTFYPCPSRWISSLSLIHSATVSQRTPRLKSVWETTFTSNKSRSTSRSSKTESMRILLERNVTILTIELSFTRVDQVAIVKLLACRH